MDSNVFKCIQEETSSFISWLSNLFGASDDVYLIIFVFDPNKEVSYNIITKKHKMDSGDMVPFNDDFIPLPIYPIFLPSYTPPRPGLIKFAKDSPVFAQGLTIWYQDQLGTSLQNGFALYIKCWDSDYHIVILNIICILL